MDIKHELAAYIGEPANSAADHDLRPVLIGDLRAALAEIERLEGIISHQDAELVGLRSAVLSSGAGSRGANMDIKQRLERLSKAAYGLEGLNVVPDTLAAVCAVARAEIERLERLHQVAVQWLGFIAKGENFTTAVCDEITMATADTLRDMARSTLKRLGG